MGRIKTRKQISRLGHYSGFSEARYDGVDRRGVATCVTKGNLRASHRVVSPAPYDNLGLSYHSHHESDLEPIPAGGPFELVFDLLPTSYLFRAGDRIRITVPFADADNFRTPILDPPPTLKLLRNAKFPTHVTLPAVDQMYEGSASRLGSDWKGL